MTNHISWRKSTYSGDQGNCIELAPVAGGIAVRDSKLGKDSPVLQFTSAELHAFLAGAKAGEFDDLV